MTFDEIVEQKHAVTTLRKTVTTGRIGHAYLFCGQRGTGKTSIARVFARAINCEAPENGNPCNKCPTCRGILDGTLMDVIEIDAASNTSVDNIRKISEEVNFAPSRAPHKVYIIDEVHMISSGAFNALLKTLEEPPAHAVFLFATTEPHRIPATVLSRCQRFDFRRISPDAISGRLRYICDQEKINAEDDALKLIASLSDGAMRDAISVLDQAASAADGKLITAESIEEITGTVDTSFLAKMTKVLLQGRFDELLILTQQLAESGRDIIRFSLDLAQYMRNLLVIRVVPNPSSLIPASVSTLKEMYEVANMANPEAFAAMISALSAMISDLKTSPAVRTSFEISLIRLCGRKVKTEIVPLTMPDFAAMQRKAAIDMVTAREASEASTKPASESEPVTSAAAPTPTPAPAPAAVEKIEEEKEEAKPLTEAKIEDEKATEEETKPSEDTKPDEEAKTVEEVKPEPEPAPIPTVAPQVKTTEEEDPDDKPLENQMDLFSFASAAPEEPEAIKEPPVLKVPVPAPAPAAATSSVRTVSKADSKPSGAHVFAGLSSSFTDDLEMPYDKSEPVSAANIVTSPAAEAPDAPKDKLNAWENRKTALASALEDTQIVQPRPAPEPVPEPEEYYGADTDTVWRAVNARIKEEDYVLWSMLKEAQFRVVSGGGYIVFEDKDRRIIEQIKDDTAYRKVSHDIKAALKEVQHVYLCTETQYSNALRTSGGLAKAKTMSKAEQLIEKSKSLGIATEIHFGDD